MLELLSAGDHVIASDDVYGGTFRLFDKVRKRTMALGVSFVDLRDLDAIKAAIGPRTRMLWVETPTTPTPPGWPTSTPWPPSPRRTA